MNEVSAAEISRNFGLWQDKAMIAPVIVTRHGKPRVVLISAETYVASQPAFEHASSAVKHTYRALLNHMINGFAEFDAALRFTTVNRAFEDLVNTAEADLLGRPLLEALPQSQKLFVDHLRRTVLTGEAAEVEFPSAMAEGRIYRARIFPCHNGVGVVLQSRQSEHEAQSIQSQLQARAAASNILPGVSWAQISLRATLTVVSESFCRLVGLSAKDLIDKALIQVVKPAFRPQVSAAIEISIRDRAPRTVEAIMFTEGLTERAVLLVFAPILDGEAVTGWQVAVAPRP